MLSTKEIHKAFAMLAEALENQKLPTEKGGLRKADADEFDWMCIHRGVHQFKHGYTRNYVFMEQKGNLIVPQTTKPFFRGTFDRGY